jgi:flagellar basal-body rod protein FlgF
MANTIFYTGLVDAVHGAQMQMRNLDIISNNLANSSTPGYKADRLLFNEQMTRELQTFFDQGNLRTTSNPLDLALQGDGFFKVKTEKGIMLTRSGAFMLRGDGTLIDGSGNEIMGQGDAPIVLNPQNGVPHIDEGGRIYQGDEEVGSLAVVDVENKRLIKKVGDNMFGPTQEDGEITTQPAKDYSLTQGSLEMPNTTIVQEMVSMITSFRAFESYQKIIHAFSEMDSKAVNQVGKVA